VGFWGRCWVVNLLGERMRAALLIRAGAAGFGNLLGLCWEGERALLLSLIRAGKGDCKTEEKFHGHPNTRCYEPTLIDASVTGEYVRLILYPRDFSRNILQ
jgi:hypothetical protein